MTTGFSLIDAISLRHAGALAVGALKPARAGIRIVHDDGLRFVLRYPEGESSAQPPGGPRDPNFNPFLPPDPELTVGPLGDGHVMVLNKFPAARHHVVLARSAFHEQQTGPELSDFRALAMLVSEAGGLGFFNGGPAAGASQRHKHVQWMPAGEHNASLYSYTQVLNDALDEQSAVLHPALPFRHCFIRVRAGKGVPVDDMADSLNRAWLCAQGRLGLHPDEQGFLPPFNLLVEEGWMLVVARSREHFEGISNNSLSYGGQLQLQNADQLALVERHGPLAVLAATAHPRSGEAAQQPG